MLIFVGLRTSTENVQKNVECDFCNQWSNSFILKSFYQIPLTWSKTYRGSLPYGSGENSHKPKVALGNYLVNAIFGLFYFIAAIFGPKIAKKTQ